MTEQLIQDRGDLFLKMKNKITQQSQSIHMGYLIDRNEVFSSGKHFEKTNVGENWKMRIERKFCSADTTSFKRKK